MQQIYFHRFEHKGVKLLLVGDEKGLTNLHIENNTREFTLPNASKENGSYFAEIEKQLKEYFDGQRTEFTLQLNPKGTEFQKKVWKALEGIPYGTSQTYKQIAEQIGNPNAARAIGLANNKNPIPIIVPCHRVIGANQKLVGYAFGTELKQQLLDLELITHTFHTLAIHSPDISRDAFDGKHSWWPAESAFEMIVGAILTQNTTWVNVEKALEGLKGNLEPQAILDMEHEKLAQAIRSSGYHNQKAKKLKAFSQWFQSYNFDIETIKLKKTKELRDELLAINGIGPETADCILVYAFDKCSFVIDAYTRRVFSRIGLEVPQKYDDFREKIEQAVQADRLTFDIYHGLLVHHAKVYCTKQPQCEKCPCASFCKKLTD